MYLFYIFFRRNVNMYKRQRNKVEQSFEKMGIEAARLLYRSIVLFPFCIIISTILIFKLFYDTWTWDPVYLLIMSIGGGVLIHIFLTMAFFEDKVEKCMRECSLNILKEMKKNGEIENVFEYKRHVRNLRNTVDGRWIRKK